jgi:hypothetical protein
MPTTNYLSLDPTVDQHVIWNVIEHIQGYRIPIAAKYSTTHAFDSIPMEIYERKFFM